MTVKNTTESYDLFLLRKIREAQEMMEETTDEAKRESLRRLVEDLLSNYNHYRAE